MLQYKAKITVKKLDESSSKREPDFDYTPELIKELEEFIEFGITNYPLISKEGEVYVLSVSNIRQV